ncbi:hypothetical protein WOLCODRAFT_151919 [Wolfiporia cocos MD-104 SS10]|uniref:Uncharacterized protein n=1 Tax=Wolfiporia cocos (strain MD-104) TaxID=742152 RepID=A0A2H3JI59_WOLCO|nr:hypothetical protein WOLCODRAFT_151919 [Wolfiporia cocos MD-104 SS10]
MLAGPESRYSEYAIPTDRTATKRLCLYRLLRRFLLGGTPLHISGHPARASPSTGYDPPGTSRSRRLDDLRVRSRHSPTLNEILRFPCCFPISAACKAQPEDRDDPRARPTGTHMTPPEADAPRTPHSVRQRAKPPLG